MLTYTYKVVTANNTLKEGTVSAFTKGLATKKLKEEGTTILTVIRKESWFSQLEFSIPFRSFTMTEKIFFFRNLGLMVGAGLTPPSSLRTLQEQIKDKKTRKAILKMADDVENGQKFSEAMKKHPKLFSSYLCESVAVGEMTGEMSPTFDRIATDLEKDYHLRKKVIGAIAYPTVVVIAMVVVGLFLSYYVLPIVAQLFDEMDVALPLPTKILLGMSTFMAENPFVILAGLVLFGAAFYASLKIPKTRYMIHGIIIKLPIFGILIREFNLAQFFRTIESLFSRGVSLVKAVEIAKKTLKNDVYSKAVGAVHPILLHGGKFTDALEPFPDLFPKHTQKIVGVGERTGKMEETFGRITDHFEKSVMHRTDMLSSLIEPILMIVVGILVGVLAVSIFMPLYSNALFESI